MTKPGGRKIMLFVVLSIAYWAIASIMIAMAAIRVCGITPDAAEACDTTSIAIVMAIAFALFAGLSMLFFKARLSGVDE
ncbi:hypothetical protein N5J77_05590 [Sphingobium yanoikuyae]|uniref:Uncharacterized protein n=1 Tax=Sphingobium yanoikuyae TaxID=13690 RepID=A0A0J9D3V7_SPHYA|nr:MULTISPECIES: hypothetical protein [Sphingobium]ATI80117.1 hypothetical protein A6768_08920 [Sphingobium yanoikuyae]ATP19669.1 hypothetical protein BV87_15550 [Sphingobium yanoikuyae]KMW31854.1 hypothetical protein BV87_20360 [Sphingobium yanoikuyae]MDH2130589.1 hypothetical protein [Sphingobium yanoikuyae]MDH2150317.1 hypothetical protein [Sphingobium yanoikuyae]